MSSEQRKAITNGVFLCSTCADMVDRNGGRDFGGNTLRAWKTKHEKWVRANLNKRPDAPLSIVGGIHEATGSGEITGLDIQAPVIIAPGTISRASGHGKVTGTRIGGPPSQER
jgi:hypothetical protein